MPRSGTSTGITRGSSLGVHATSSQAPPRSLSDFESVRPSMDTPPASATSAAKVREKPSIFASAASTRAPSSPSGTGRLRDSMSDLGVAPGSPGLRLGREVIRLALGRFLDRELFARRQWRQTALVGRDPGIGVRYGELAGGSR